MHLVQQEAEESVDWRSTIMDNGGQCARMDSVQLMVHYIACMCMAFRQLHGLRSQ